MIFFFFFLSITLIARSNGWDWQMHSLRYIQDFFHFLIYIIFMKCVNFTHSYLLMIWSNIVQLITSILLFLVSFLLILQTLILNLYNNIKYYCQTTGYQYQCVWIISVDEKRLLKLSNNCWELTGSYFKTVYFPCFLEQKQESNYEIHKSKLYLQD